MTDSTITLADVAPEGTAMLTRRRTLFAGLVAATMIAVLWLAAIAVPPTSFGAISFLVLFTITLPWSVIGFWNAFIGFWIMRLSRDPAVTVNPMAASIRGDEPITATTAILMCIRNESPEPVERNLQPLLEGLVAANVADKFHVYVLSDSSIPEIIAEETALVEAFTAKWHGVIPVTYRRREINTAFKSGNIRDVQNTTREHGLFLVNDVVVMIKAENATSESLNDRLLAAYVCAHLNAEGYELRYVPLDQNRVVQSVQGRVLAEKRLEYVNVFENAVGAL